MGTVEGMTRKSYGQFCGLAHALDVVGERWTLLLVRELVSGPKRYTELAEALSGIGTSLLATRVRQLESDGVIQRRLALDQPGSTVVYELSDAGRELAAAVVPLAMWGARHQMADADPTARTAPRRVAVELPRGRRAPRCAAGPRRGVRIRHRRQHRVPSHCTTAGLPVTPGKSPTPSDVTVRASAPTIAALVGGKVTLTEAIAQGRLDVTGDGVAIAALLGVIEKRLGQLALT